jgi:hypothetical protein
MLEQFLEGFGAAFFFAAKDLSSLRAGRSR